MTWWWSGRRWRGPCRRGGGRPDQLSLPSPSQSLCQRHLSIHINFRINDQSFWVWTSYMRLATWQSSSSWATLWMATKWRKSLSASDVCTSSRGAREGPLLARYPLFELFALIYRTVLQPWNNHLFETGVLCENIGQFRLLWCMIQVTMSLYISYLARPRAANICLR